MTGDERFPEPGPVAEYRDPELVRRFEREVPPQHGPGFWTELESRLTSSADRSAGGTDGADSAPDGDLGTDDHEDAPSTLLGPSVTEPIPLVPSSAGPRWGTGRWLAVAAATIAVVGLGGAVLIGQSRSSSPVESAAPTPGVESDDDEAAVGQDAAVSSTVTTRPPMTTTTAPASTTSLATSAVDQPVDYFDDAVRVDSIGPGQALAFSPDGSALLVLDDAPGVAGGCEGAELLALYTQDLATGERRPAMGTEARIETGGLDLLVDPFGATPDEVGTRPIYGQEWCDGEVGQRWRGTLTSDGQITMAEPIEVGGADDPFVASADSGSSLIVASPDGRHLLTLSEVGVQVVEVDGEAGADDDPAEGTVVATAPDDLVTGPVTAGAWSPDGQAVALGTMDSLLLWNPWTGASQRFDADPARDVLFDPSGGRLAVAGGDSIVVLTFGSRPVPVPAGPRCSGRFDVAALTAERLAKQGLSAAAADTVLAIDTAAAICDWAALDLLAPDDFIASFGGGDPVELWQREEAEGGSPMWYLRTLFRQPHVVTTVEDGTVHLWPAIHQDDDCTLDDQERAIAIALGLDPTAAEESCVTIGGYAGYRTTIGADGIWRAFLAGD